MRRILGMIVLVIAGAPLACSNSEESPGSGESAGAMPLVCSEGYVDCTGVCVDLQGDGQNCGTCGTPCPSEQVCSAGICQDSCGVPGQTRCGSSCVDVLSNPSHCGGCDLACDPGNICQAGVCPGADPGGSGGDAATGGGPSYFAEVLIEEGELGQCEVDGVIESTNLGFTGGGYLNTDNLVGASIEWALDVGEAGTYAFEFVYANLSLERPGEVLVAGLSVGNVTFASTASWDTWSSESVELTLAPGENRVVLRATSEAGLPNLDSVKVTGVAVRAADCDGNAGTGGSDGTGGTASEACVPADGHYQMEDLDRGVVAVRGNNGNYVGWRMLGYEYDRDTPDSVGYNLYRDGALVANVTESTNYFDAGAAAGASYSVGFVKDGAECEVSPAAAPWAQNYLRVPLSPLMGYTPNDTQPADLDGDGEYELVVKWYPDNSKDNSQSGVTDNTILEGVKLDGTSLWRIDLGRNVRSGAHYTQMSIYDFDGDGRAEVSVKTAPGTRDASGDFLSLGPAANDDDNADYRNGSGYVLTGPEYLTVFDGLSGEELATVNYPVPRGTVGSWGDNYGNRVDRFNGGVAMVTDGGQNTGRPSIVQQRGYYTRLTMSAYHFREGQLTQNWLFDSNGAGNGAAAGQGDHSSMTADMDGDGAQEITTGALTIGSDGSFRCSTGHGHGDAMHVGELVPGAGISVFTVYEGAGGFSVHNGNTCEAYAVQLGGGDNGRGAAADVDPNNPGAEFWSATMANLRSCSDGSTVATAKPQSQNFLIYWDADESRELQDGASIQKYGGGTLLTASGCSGNNGTKNTPNLTADLLGDWREELVVRESNNTALRIYTTTDVTDRRIYTLMHDPTYRMQVTWEQSSYNQPPHPGFHIGQGMVDPPEPDIHVR